RLPEMLRHQWLIQCRELLEKTGDEPQAPPNLVLPGSHCPACKTPLRPWHNIPLLSFLFLRGKCAYCKAPISRRYPLLELFTALVTLQAGIHFGLTLQLAAALFLAWSLIALSAIDIDHQLLPDGITLPLLWAGFLVNLFELFVPLMSAVIGAMAGYLILWLIYQLHHRLTGKEGMGYGDFKLLAALGAWMGWQKLPLIILLAAVTGTLIALFMMIRKGHGRDVPIPFGPYLTLAGWIAIIWGDQLIASYLQFAGIDG
ncbi:MAG: A24 family peptidase, partial [Pseudomonadota bacterium]|nr:A24 family peptidase [Pseudomonadota bacterium]